MGRKKKINPLARDLAEGETLTACTCPNCGTRFPVAVRALGPKPPRAPDPRQLPFEFVRGASRRSQISLSELTELLDKVE